MTREESFFFVPLRRSREKRSFYRRSSTLGRGNSIKKTSSRLLKCVDDKRIEEGKALRNHRANRTAEEAFEKKKRKKETKSLDKSDEN